MDFKVRLVSKKAGNLFTVGEVYNFTNNTIVSDGGFRFGHWDDDTTLNEINEWFAPYYKFELVVENKIIITTDGKTTNATLYRGDMKFVGEAYCSPEDKFDFMFGANLAMKRLNEVINPKLKIEIGKKYKLKEFDKVENNFGINEPTWDKIIKYPIIPISLESTNNYFVKTKYLSWYMPYEFFEREWDDTKDALYNGKVICIKADGCLYDHAKVGKIYTFNEGMCENEVGNQFMSYPVKSLDEINSRLKHIQFIELVED